MYWTLSSRAVGNMDARYMTSLTLIGISVALYLIIPTCGSSKADLLRTDGGDDMHEYRSARDAFKMSPMAAKSFLRYRRGWFKKITGEERDEEREGREDSRERSERGREAKAREDRLNRVCPTSCWGSWATKWSACSAPCGNSGVQSQTRKQSVSSECQGWVKKNGCPGTNIRYQNCNRFCRNGGKPLAKSCSCGAGWKGTCCQTRVVCNSPGKPQNGEASPFGKSLPYNTVVKYSCHTGYTLQGSTSRKCQNDGKWSNAIGTCKLVACGNPGVPTHGSRNGNIFTFGSQVVYSCSTGYLLQWSSVSRCEANGKWSKAKPSCKVVSCGSAGSLQNGAVTTPSGTTYGKEARFTCNAGYKIQGSATRICQPNGQWGGRAPTCQIVLCPVLANPAHGSVTLHSMHGKAGIKHRGAATYTCSTGYTLSGNNRRTCNTGVWSGSNPTCKIRNCGDPGSPAHGTRTGSFTYNSHVTFKCTAGYIMAGSASITCNPQGRWTATKPTCKVCPRNTYKAGTNAVSSCTACPAHSTTSSTGHSHISQCSCNKGYKRLSNNACKLITCPALTTPSHSTRQSCGTNYNQVCRFACIDGHILSHGDSARRCQDNGKWSGNPIVCTACPVNNYKSGVSVCARCPVNSHTTGPGSSLSGCVCDAGFTGNPGGPCSDLNECSTKNGGCEQTCINIEGSYRCTCTLAGYIRDADDSHRCVAKNKCPTFPTPANGGAVCLAQRSTSTERCEVKCNPGYEHMEKPNAFEECGPSTNWHWSFELINAQITECMEAFFPDLQVEAEVFYFVGKCAVLSPSQIKAVKDEFLNYLISKGLCQETVRMACNIGELRVDCGPDKSFDNLDRRRQTVSRDELRFKFEIKIEHNAEKDMGCSAACQEGSKVDCNAACKAAYMIEASKVLEKNKAIMNQAFGKNMKAIPTDRMAKKWGRIVPKVKLEGTLVVNGITLMPTGSPKVSTVEAKCETGMERRDSACVPCQSGAYLPPGGSRCVQCPIGTFQNRAQQTRCMPCTSAKSLGMAICPKAS